MDRVCFTMRVAREHIPRYVEMHRRAWPELLLGLHSTGWQNYSLFLRPDGTLVGYWESADAEASMAAMAEVGISAQWSVEMDRLVVPGSIMSYPTLTRTLGPTGAGGGERYLVVLEPGHPFVASDEHFGRLAEFITEAGERVLYGELASGAAVPESTFAEVFNLDALLKGHS
ncbi:hypothetical protein BH11ACT5_BH11ACT5_20730 [soil metagenome]